MVRKRTKRRIAFALKLAMCIIIWEFTFPGHAIAAENQNTYPVPTILTTLRIENIEPSERLPLNADKPREPATRTVYLSITAYSSTPDQTDGDPFTTASGSTVRDGIIAANFLPIGTRVRIPDYYGDKIFIVEDRMNARYWYMADIWMPSRQEAKEWGVRYTKLEVLD
ncbi:MAG: hypothetical protein WC289_04495 [Patescibacteria group bacterium]|jgi:3D (Asp-Asp-Asp) domain-containing protein